MDIQIICFNPKCEEVPVIKLIHSNTSYKIVTDCPLHHYRYELEEYLQLLKKQAKKYSSVCSEHNKEYEVFFEDTHLNACQDCLLNKKEKEIIFFKDIKVDENNYCNIFSNDSLEQLYTIIIRNFIYAKENNKIVAGIYLNYMYIISYKEYKPISNDQEIKIESKVINLNNKINFFHYQFKLNFKYLIRIFHNNIIEVWILEKNECISINDNTDMFEIELSPFYYQIFLTVSSKNVKIWEINEDKREINLKTTIYLEKNSQENFRYASFSSINEKIIFSISKEDIIKIWDLENMFYIKEINFFKYNNVINIISSPGDESIIGIQTSSDNYIYNIEEEKIINQENGRVKYCNFIDSETIIVVKNSFIEIKNFKKNNTYKIKNIFGIGQYFYEDDLLYIFGQYLFILGTKNEKYQQIKELIENFKNINNKQDGIENNFFNFIEIEDKQIILYSLNSNYFSKKSTKKQLKNKPYYFLKKNRKCIYDKSELSFSNITPNKSEVYIKKYLENEKILNQVKENYKITLNQKKNNVENELKNYHELSSLSEEYFHLLSLLIKDNTNKSLIEKYLIFLKKNEKQLNIHNIETYKNELDYYKVMFTPDEIKNIFNEEKKLCEKDKFINLLTDLLSFSENEYNEFKNSIIVSKLGRFNQKINFDNNSELYWFRNQNLILYLITKIDFSDFCPIKYCIRQVLSKNILNDNNIIENKQRLSVLIINLVTPQSEDAYNYNLNLITSFSIKSEEEFENLLIEKGFIKNEGKYYLPEDKNRENRLDPKTDFDICLDNYILNIRKNKQLEPYELFTFDKKIEKFSPKIDLPKIKNYLSKFLVSNLFKEIYFIIYPDNFIFPFSNIETSKKFIDENFSFLPMENEKEYGSTDKFTLETYIYLCKKGYYHVPSNFNYNDEQNLLLLSELMTGRIVKTGYHEIIHDMYNIYFYHSNGLISLKTPQKNVNGEFISEIGKEIEVLLFGKFLKKINLKEVLYILNEKNLDKGIGEFRNDFALLNDCDLDVKGEFEYFNEIKNSSYYKDIKDFSISTEEIQDLLSIEVFNDDDTL